MTKGLHMWMYAGARETAPRIAGHGSVEIFDHGGERLVLGDNGMPADGATTATLLFTGGVYAAKAGPYLFRVGMWTPEEDRDDFLAWYETDHLPILLENPIWDGCRFIEVAAESGCQFYVLHQMQDPAALRSNERARSRNTDWFHRLKEKEWFDEPFTRTLYRRIFG